MQISSSQMDLQSLEQFGQDAVDLLHAGNFSTLAERFGYARAFDREKSAAIEADLGKKPCQDAERVETIAPSITVTYFTPAASHDTGLVAAVECVTTMADGFAVQLALVVTAKGPETFITLEDVNRV